MQAVLNIKISSTLIWVCSNLIFSTKIKSKGNSSFFMTWATQYEYNNEKIHVIYSLFGLHNPNLRVIFRTTCLCFPQLRSSFLGTMIVQATFPSFMCTFLFAITPKNINRSFKSLIKELAMRHKFFCICICLFFLL